MWRFAFELLPIILFFVGYKWGGIYSATLIALVASMIQVVWLRIVTKKFEPLPLITLATVGILGGATLFFRNELFIKWKPTVVYGILSLTFWLSRYWDSKPLIQRIAEHSLQLPEPLWIKLNQFWVVFFTLMGLLNIYVLTYFDTNTWVNFKLFGIVVLTALFIIIQAIYLAKYMKTSEMTSAAEDN